MSGGLLWITTALSTLKPATSPCLSTVHVQYLHPSDFDEALDAMAEDLENDIPPVMDEVIRIRHEFGGEEVGTISVGPEY